VINVGTLSKLRRLVLRDGLSVRQASLRLGISRNTATKWLSEPEMVEPQYPVRQSAASVLDPYKEQLVTWLKADSHRNKRERRGVKAFELPAVFRLPRVDGYHRSLKDEK
jgi:transposase